MHIEHIALWTGRLEGLKDFYEKYFQARTGEKYQNLFNGFESYFLSFSKGARVELMSQADLQESAIHPGYNLTGYAHISFAAGSEHVVDMLTNRLRQDGYIVISDPRHTGDGYYESVIADPDGNYIEITA